jgi:hypothetical protein
MFVAVTNKEVVPMASKKPVRRAPGGGRKPQGKIAGNYAVLNLRVTPKLRIDVERAAEKSGLSLSQEAQKRLDDSFADDRLDRNKRPDHVRALGTIIAMVAVQIERWTRKRWVDDPDTARHIQDAAEFIIRHFGKTPPPVDRPDRTPSGFSPSESIGWNEAADFIYQIERWHYRNLEETFNLMNPHLDNVPTEFSVFHTLAEHLGIRKKAEDLGHKPKAARGTSPHRNPRKSRAQRAAEAKIRHEVDEDRQKHVALETCWRFMRKQNGT